MNALHQVESVTRQKVPNKKLGDSNLARAKRKREGSCPTCGGTSAKPGKRCSSCARYEADAVKERRKAAREAGRCAYCKRSDCPSLDPRSFGMFRQTCLYQELRRLIRKKPGSRGAELFAPLLHKHGWPGILNEITDEQVNLFLPPPKARVRRFDREIADRPLTPSDVLFDAILQFLGNLADLPERPEKLSPASGR